MKIKHVACILSISKNDEIQCIEENNKLIVFFPYRFLWLKKYRKIEVTFCPACGYSISDQPKQQNASQKTLVTKFYLEREKGSE